MDVQAAGEYAKLTGVQGSLAAGDLPGAAPMGEVTQWIKEQRLINVLKAGQYEEAGALFDQILDQLLHGNMTRQAIKCNMYSLINALSRAATESDFLQSNPGAEVQALTEQLGMCDDLQTLKETVHALLRLQKATHTPSREEKMDAVAMTEEAISIIQQSYADQLLSVTGVAEQMRVSPVTLTRAFKKVLNMGVLDYIHHSRMHVAKQLLLNTNENILSIAQRTGYNNNVTFIRVFKKIEGVTPGQYRSAKYE